MVQPWWAAVAVPVVVAKGIITGRNKGRRMDAPSVEPEDDGSEPRFVCERVCTSEKLLKKLGSLAKDPTPNTCVTVCGTSALDACTDACQRCVCVNMHHVPGWNEQCLKKCTTECMKGR